MSTDTSENGLGSVHGSRSSPHSSNVGQDGRPQLKKDDHSPAPYPAASTPPEYRTSSVDLNFELQVTAPPIDSSVRQQIDELRALISKEPVYREHPFIQSYCTDQLLHRYIRARPASLSKAKQLLLETLTWRASYRPDLILAQDVSDEASSGKILTLHKDQFGRPIILMDNSFNRTHDHAAAIRHLVFHLERAAQHMEPPVEKYCLVVDLSHHSLWNQPPIKTSLETTHILMKHYCEHLGSAICYQPPTVFSLLYAAASPFFDAHMTRKIVWVKGSTEEGGDVDQAMTKVVGPAWKNKCRVDLGTEPRYDHAKEWPRVMQEQKAWLQATGRWEDVKVRWHELDKLSV